ncbi:MAG: 50S ribosomal protein L29 [Candidatus Micrarchaeia archaeon]
MAIIKKNELETMDSNALQKKLEEIEVEITREKGATKTTGRPNNPGKYREMRKLRARIKTSLTKRKASKGAT